MIRRSDDGKIRILSLSYGKDSLACLGAIEELGLPLDGIVHAEVWATDDIPADLPPMVEFKAKADKIIKERWGFDVEHICAMTTPDKKYGVFKRPCEGGRNSLSSETSTEDSKMILHMKDALKDSQPLEALGADISNCKVKLTYQDIFYRPMHKKDEKGGQFLQERTGFANKWALYCNSELKKPPIHQYLRISSRQVGWCHRFKQQYLLGDGLAEVANGVQGNSRMVQQDSFPRSPMHEGLKQISCSIWESLRMSLNGSNGTARRRALNFRL